MDTDSGVKIPIPICEICFSEFNHHKNKPLIIIPCCHSFCDSCLNQIKQKCPKCSSCIKMKSVNWSLLNIIPESTYREVDNKTISNEWFKKGVDLFNKKYYQEAVVALDTAISIQPHFEMFYTKGKCLVELRKYQETVVECEKAITLAPNKPKPHYLKGFALYKMKRYVDAIYEFDLVNILAPNEFMPYHLKASSLHQMGSLNEAIEYYNKSLRINAEYFPSINNKKIAVLQLDKLRNTNTMNKLMTSNVITAHTMTLRPRKNR